MDFSYDESAIISENDIKAELQKEEIEPESYHIEAGTVLETFPGQIVSGEETALTSEQPGLQTSMEQDSPMEKFLPDLKQDSPMEKFLPDLKQEDKLTSQSFLKQTVPNEELVLDLKQQGDKPISQLFVAQTIPSEELKLDLKDDNKPMSQNFVEQVGSNEGLGLDFKQQEDKPMSQIFPEVTISNKGIGLDLKQQEDKPMSQTFLEETIPNEGLKMDLKQQEDKPMSQTFPEETIPNEELKMGFKQQDDKPVSQTFFEQTVPHEGLRQDDEPVTQASLEHTLPNEESAVDIKQEEEKPFYGAFSVEAASSSKEEINQKKEMETSGDHEITSSKMSLDNEREYSELQPPKDSSLQGSEEFQSQTTLLTIGQGSTGDSIYDQNATTYGEGVMDTVQTMQHKSDIEEESLEKEIEDLTSQTLRILHKPKDTHRYTPVDESAYSSNSEGEEYSTKHDYSKEISSDPKEVSKASGIEKKEHLYKILVIGELGTGKTSIIKRYVHQFFSQHYRATIGVDFALKVISWDTDTLIRLQLWDIAGQERFGNMTRVYYKEAVGAFVVFDVTRVPTFEAVVKWKNDLDSKVQLSDGSNIPCVLLANKCDQTKEGLVNNTDQMDDFCKDKGFLNWFETSAKENINIDEAARYLVGQILKNDQSLHTGSTEEDKERIQLANATQQESTKKSCCR